MNVSGNNTSGAIEPDQAYETDSFRPQDAAGLVNLFRAVYGEDYPIKLFYDEKALTDANVTGSCYSLVARTVRGDVIGAEHVFRSAPFSGVYEAGSGLVLKEYRNKGITTQLLRFVLNEWAPRRENIEEIFGEPVCNHTHMQKAGLQFGCLETALEVALMPAEAYDRERSSAGRVAALMAFRSYTPKPHMIHLPPAYEDQLRSIYTRSHYPRDLARADRGLSDSTSSRADTTFFDFAQVARIAMHETGSDLTNCLSELEGLALKRKVSVLQVWLNLGDPCVGAAADVLRDDDYFFGGMLPRWFDRDGLLMQKVLCEPNFEGIHLHSDRARHIGAMVLEDWKRTQKGAVNPHFA